MSKIIALCRDFVVCAAVLFVYGFLCDKNDIYFIFA